MKAKVYNFDIKGDERGLLIALEENRNIPFTIKRVFYIYNTLPGVNRGEHAHFLTQQLLICIKGSCMITLDDGKDKQTIKLDSPDKALLQKQMIWGKMYDFSDDCVLMVLADRYYEESDYIRSYDTFIKYVNYEEII